ncbi:hypothetical protein FRX31_034833, partial [Thalictrum thalictroides]
FLPFGVSVVATTENDENWEWFLQNLKEVVSLQWSIIFISNRHSSLLKFVPVVFPNSSHGYCFWHLKLNLRTTIKGRSRNCKFIEGLFKECAYAYTIREFDEKYNDLMVGSKDNKQDVLDFLSRVPFEHWANEHFPGSRTNIVDLGHFSCTCGRWRVEGIPCAHALRCIIVDGRPIQDFIDPMFSVLFYCQSYSHNIPPVDVDIGYFTTAHKEVVIPPEVRNH